jgi:chorismate dehydratase
MLRIGAISYLNTRPLTYGLQQAATEGRIDLTQANPAELAELLIRGKLDVSLLSVTALERAPDVQVVPGLGIATSGVCRSVLLISRGPVSEIKTLALDSHSHTSNRLAQILCRHRWNCAPRTVIGAETLGESLELADSAVRIGDKALFESVPADCEVHDLSELWMQETGLPFVFAVWVARRGLLDDSLTALLNSSLDAGLAAVDSIAADYRWQGTAYPEIAHEYLTRNIHYRIGAEESKALDLFHQQTLEPTVEQRG